MNKKLLIVVIILIPITIISFFHKETNFIMPQNNINVSVELDKETISIPLEEYVIGVVGGEMPASFELDALKAQAIASRTYVINHLEKYDTISNTINDQVYLTEEELKEKWKDKYEYYYNKIKEAVDSTENMIMTYDNKPIKAYYYSKSNGYTESSFNVFNEVNNYLIVTPSPWEKNIIDTKTITKEEFCNKLSISCKEITINNIKKDESNRIETIMINNKTYKGTQVRKLLNLKSTDFEIEIQNNKLEITTKGYGHGVGMSQYGANEMAKLGYSYDDILKYYYKNTEINNI